MCGLFAAITNGDGFSEPLNIIELVAALTNRGPDSLNVHTTADTKFYHSLLSISSGGAHVQPYSDDRHILAFNGEIYNYIELGRLLTLGSENTSETKVVFEFIKERGIVEFCELAIGMFALIFHDTLSKTTYLARDYFGQKPLYYHISDQNLFIASQQTYLKIAVPPDRISIDNHELRSSITLGFSNVGRSLFKEIQPVERGEIIEFKVSKRIQSFFYTPTSNDDEIDLYVRNTFGYTPHLSFSGGIDSSYIAAQLAMRGPLTFVPVALSSDQPENSERNRIDKVANLLNISPEILLTSKESIEESAKVLLNAHSDPVLDPGAPLSYALLSHVSKNTRIVLGGDGGDEIYFGYSRMIKIHEVLRRLSFLPRNIIRVLGKYLYGYAIGGYKGVFAINSFVRERANERLAQTMEIDNFLQQVLAKNDVISLLTGTEYRSPLLSYSRLATVYGNPDPINAAKEPISLFSYTDKAGFDVYDKFNLVEHLADIYQRPIRSLEARLNMRFNKLSTVEKFRFISVSLFLDRVGA